MDELTQLQQQIYNDLINKGLWTDPQGLIQITADRSESAGKFNDATGKWTPEFEFISIDVLKPEADSPYNVKGKKGISQLRNLFNKVRFALPGGETYRLHADTPRKARKYQEWFENDPLVKDSGEFGTKIINGKRVDYPVLDLEVPDLKVIGVDIDGRPIFERPTTSEGIAYARKMHEAYIAGGESTQGLKPYWRDVNGVDWEIEGKGKQYQTKYNPKGLRFGNVEKHKSRAQFRRLKESGKVISLDERIALMAEEFPGAPNDQIKELATNIHNYNEDQIREATSIARKNRWHLEDRTPVSGDTHGWRSWHNLKPDDPEFNLKKSAIFPGEEYATTHNIGATKAQQVTFDRSSPLTPEGTQITPEIDRANIRDAVSQAGKLPAKAEGVRQLGNIVTNNPITRGIGIGNNARLASIVESATDLAKGIPPGARFGLALLPGLGIVGDTADAAIKHQEAIDDPTLLNKAQDWVAKSVATTSVIPTPTAQAYNFVAGLGLGASDVLEHYGKEISRAIGSPQHPLKGFYKK